MPNTHLTNLYEETISIMDEYGKSPKDVEWVGSKNGEYYCTWRTFKQIAKEVNYDDGFGSPEIYTDLVVVGDDWWLERYEYDGSEGWEFKTKPQLLEKAKYLLSEVGLRATKYRTSLKQHKGVYDE